MPNDIDGAAATAHLRAADPVMAAIIDRVGPFAMRPPAAGAFQALARSIMFQQISGSAATAIYARFLALFGGEPPADPSWDGPDHAFPSSAALLALQEEQLRSAGLSRQKIAALRSLSEHFIAGALGDVPFATLDDEAVIERLVRVRGIGRWTAEMFLMFYLARPDILPVNDVGINRAIARQYGVAMPLRPADVLRVGAAWRPFATVACWYLWRTEDVLTIR